jgi:NADPH:quinone reductase-like Zn-dependent oxidoreductase
MKAVKLKGSGEPRDVLTLSDIDNLPPPNGSNVVVHIRKRAVHPADYQTIRGFLSAEVFAPGGIPGIDGVGVVEAIGPDVDPASGISVGTRVIVYHAHATWAERVAAPASTLMPLPDDVDDAVATQLATNGITAAMLLRAAEQAIEGRTEKAPLLVTAAGSGVARSVIALGRLKGHEVIGVVRRDADAAGLAEQFDKVPVIGTDRANWPDAVKAAAGQPPVVAIDAIGGEMMPALLGLLAPGGTLVTYGALDGRPSPIHSGFVTAFELTIRGCSAMGWATRTPPEQRAADFAALFDLVRRAPHLFAGYREFALADVVQAIAAAEASPRRGATILVSP